MNINQYERYKSKDEKRLFIVLGKWFLGTIFKDYDILDVYEEKEIRIKREQFESEIEKGNLVRIIN